MQVLQVQTKSRPYSICFERGLLQKEAANFLRQTLKGDKIAIVTDDGAGPLYAETLKTRLEDQGFEVAVISFPAGEKSKSAGVLLSVYDRLLAFGITREDTVVALGGGVVGDLGGFAAATVLRGVPLVQIPTTLLAQVDSSVGGKVAIDMPAGKNLVGAFYQPNLVLMDFDVLATLPRKRFADGLAEMIKYGVIYDEELFEKLEEREDPLFVDDPFCELIIRCCDIKRTIVEEDERDTGIRMLLNFGHSFGHVYEKYHHYETYTHGEGVAAGMVTIARLGEKLGLTREGTAKRIARLLQRCDLPTSIPMPDDIDWVGELLHDKKAGSGGLNLIFAEQIGKAKPVYFSEEELHKLVKKL